MDEAGNLDRDIDLVLVTGGGASREFGINHTPVPLMGEWSNALVAKIGQRSSAYLEATGLATGLDGPEFERRLGQFLQMAQALPQIDGVLQPSLRFQPPPGNLVEQSLVEWHRQAMHHVGQIQDLIHESLYESFSYERMDLDAGAQAYGMLLQQLGVTNVTNMVYATTNYDVLGEYVIERLGGMPDWGEQHQLLLRGEAPLRVEGLLGGMPRYVPVLHLHGRVGWYRRPGQRPYSGNVTRHNEGYGAPIVMLPDPNKEYDNDPVVFSIWNQFEEALRRARRVFVLGHSLNDQVLVETLRTNVSPPERVAVTVLADDTAENGISSQAAATLGTLSRELQAAAIIPVTFTENRVSIAPAIQTWNERLERATQQSRG